MHEAEGTLRERIRALLRRGPATARDVSREVGIQEKEVPDHLGHLQRSARAHGERLVLEPAECLECGFAFTRRARYRRPSRCPRCRSARISLPRFWIEER